MITNFKIYESIYKLPKKGDYVLCEEKQEFSETINKLIKDKIGIIVDVNNYEHNPYNVKFLELIDISKMTRPDRYHLFNDNCRTFNESEIIHFSKDREYLEALINSKKYNI